MHNTKSLYNKYTGPRSEFETVDQIHDRLKAAGYHPTKSGDNVKALCPLHERTGEHSRSLNIDVKDGGGLKFHCHGGCDQDKVFEALTSEDLPTSTATLKAVANENDGHGLIWQREMMGEDSFLAFCNQDEQYGSRLTEDYYRYRDIDGQGSYLKATLRLDGKRVQETFGYASKWTNDKNGREVPFVFKRSGLDRPLPLYGTHLLADVGPDQTVWAVEGEKDVDTLAAHGQVAVSIKMFGGGYVSQRIACLAGHKIVVVPDNDPNQSGLVQARRFTDHVNKLPNVSVVMLPPLESPLPNGTTKPGYDVTDYISDGGTMTDLYDLASKAQPMPEPEDRAESVDELVETDRQSEYDEALQKAVAKKVLDAHAADMASEVIAEQRRDRAGISVENLGVDFTDPEVIAPKPPAVLISESDQALLYPGQINTVFGKGGSLKSWLALYAAAQELKAGNSVAMLSLELSPRELFKRMTVNLGVPTDALVSRFFVDRHALARGKDILEAATKKTKQVPSLMIVDSVNKVLAAYEWDGWKALQIIQYHNIMAAPFQDVGVTFLNIDHCSHEAPHRPTGSQEKTSAVQGAMYGLNVPPGFRPAEGKTGYAEITLRKDQPGETSMEVDTTIAWLAFYQDGQIKLHTDQRPMFAPSTDAIQLKADLQCILDHLKTTQDVYANRTDLANALFDPKTQKPILKTWMNRINKLINDGLIEDTGSEVRIKK